MPGVGIRSRVIRWSGTAVILLGLLLAVCLPSAAQETEVIRAYPAVYDLSRLADGQREVLVSGDVLLMEGDSVRVAEPSAGPAGNHRITLDLGVHRSEQAPRRLAVSLAGEIVVLTGERRMELDDRGGFITGPETQRISFESQNWLSLDDPSPLEAVHQQGDVSYVFTLMLQDVAYR